MSTVRVPRLINLFLPELEQWVKKMKCVSGMRLEQFSDIKVNFLKAGGSVAEWSKALHLREKINENQMIPGSPPPNKKVFENEPHQPGLKGGLNGCHGCLIIERSWV